MVNIYVKLIHAGYRKIEDVPEIIRKEVQEKIEEIES